MIFSGFHRRYKEFKGIFGDFEGLPEVQRGLKGFAI